MSLYRELLDLEDQRTREWEDDDAQAREDRVREYASLDAPFRLPIRGDARRFNQRTLTPGGRRRVDSAFLWMLLAVTVVWVGCLVAFGLWMAS